MSSRILSIIYSVVISWILFNWDLSKYFFRRKAINKGLNHIILVIIGFFIGLFISILYW